MRYFCFEQDENLAVKTWNNSQFDLADIVLFLTDNGIMLGAKIYAIFNRGEVKNLLRFFVCDLNLMKKDLQINHYIERKGDALSKFFNPKRIITTNYISKKQLFKRAEFVYKNLINDLNIIATRLKMVRE